MKGQKNKTGFPLETCGNDSGGTCGNDSGGTCGNDRRGPDMPAFVIPAAPSVIPDVSNRESKVFPK